MNYQYYEKIRKIREDCRYSQQQIAQILHVGQRTYSDYECGKIRIPLDGVIQLAKFYDINLDYITGISSVRQPFPRK